MALYNSAAVMSADCRTELYRSKSTFEAQGGYEEMAGFVLRRNPFALDLVKPYRRTPVLVA